MRAKDEAVRALLTLAEEEARLKKNLSQLEEQDEIGKATIKASAVRRWADHFADMHGFVRRQENRSRRRS